MPGSTVSRTLWRGQDREALDRSLNNSTAVPNSAAIVADWQARSAALRARRPEHLGIPYGERPRNRIDFLLAEPGAPTLAFIHGGYWQMREKETFTFIAEGPLSVDVNVALIGYTLAPDATIDDMVGEIRSALDLLRERLGSLGGDADRVWLSGWSAGGHLTSMALDHPIVRGGLAISGLYELEPIRQSYLNDKLGLDDGAVARNSPLRHVAARSKRLELAVGGAELDELRRQSLDFAEARRAAGLPGSLLDIPGLDHFTILEQLAQSDGELTRLVRNMVDS